MNDAELISRLWQFGHFRNPDFPDAGNVEEPDLRTVKLSDLAVRDAIRSYQQFFQSDLDQISKVKHGREAIVDGQVGPATVELIRAPRCGVPEFFDREEANWPTACRGELKTAYEMRLRGLSADRLEAMWCEMQRNWNGALEDVDLSLDKSEDAMNTAHIYARGGALPGSTLAWSYLAQSSCLFRAQQKYDTSIGWSEVLFLTTACHEIGHALGMVHQRDPDSLLFPSVNAAARARRGFPNDTDLAQCRRLGYTVAADPKPLPEEPDSPAPSPPGGPARFQIDNGDFEIRCQKCGSEMLGSVIERAFR